MPLSQKAAVGAAAAALVSGWWALTTASRALVGPAAPLAGAAVPAVMILSSEAGRAGFCTAAVLFPEVALTAAHCVPPGAELRAHFRDPDGAPRLFGVAAVARDPLYRPEAPLVRRRSIDLALVRLATPLPARFAPLALDQTGAVTLGERFRILGYGVAKERDARTAGVLRTGVLAARAPLSKILLWAQDPSGRGLGACWGDSGAPVLSLDGARLVAIVDWATGPGARRCGAVTQAALVAPQLGWIKSTLAAWGRR